MAWDNVSDCKFGTICIFSVRCGACSKKDMSCYRKDRRSWFQKHFGNYYDYICNLKHEKAFVEVFSSYKEPRRAEELRKMGYKKYVIKKGDTLIGICKKYYCDIDEIIRLNDIEDRNLIYAGDILYLDTIENVD